MKKDNVAMYLRLSREDGLDESSSISSQREFLGGYIKKRGWTLYKEYIDDGYTGTNFNRPGFNEMVDDMEHGYVNILLIKDLSRLGRNYIYVGTLLEEYFPQKGIRVVAVNDNYDSETSEDDFIPLRNVFNEFYAKDTSKKIRSVLNNKAKNGESRYTAVTRAATRVIIVGRSDVVLQMVQNNRQSMRYTGLRYAIQSEG